MVNKLPTFWGLSYYLTDNFFVNLIVSKIRRVSNWLNSGKLARYLLQTKPDVIVSTHFFSSEVIADMKESGILKSRLVTVVTDYRLHSWWICDFTDTYVVAGQAAKDDLIKWKVDPAKIKVFGIPVEPVFTKKLDRAKTLQKLNLKEGMFTILVIGGGFGVGPIEDIVKAIEDVRRGKVEFRLDKQSGIHISVGKLSFTEEKLGENISKVIEAINEAKPASVKGKFINSLFISSSMNPGLRLAV